VVYADLLLEEIDEVMGVRALDNSWGAHRGGRRPPAPGSGWRRS